MRVIRTSKAAKISIMLATLVLLVLILAPWWAGRADIRLMGELFLYLALASLWNLMAGYAGLVSVGQQAYVGFGGYMLFALTIFAGFPPVVAIVGAGALVNRDVKPYALMVGVPARQVGWMSAYGEQLDLPLEGKTSTRCQYSGDEYKLTGAIVARRARASGSGDL